MTDKTCFYCSSVQNISAVEAYEIGKSIERERIIKLLEEADPVFTEYAIELIKGETND